MSQAYDPFYDPSDRNVPEFYCVHGTFIGNPYGGDYLCGWCEDGIPEEDYRRIMRMNAAYALRSSTARRIIEATFPLTREAQAAAKVSFENPAALGILLGLSRFMA